ncbi:TPA: hypothetical protein U5499_003143 [Legionella pneumophila]|nr:hypothetical protein [Legionella pneumophila]
MLAPIVEIFCDIDDFCKGWFKEKSPYLLPSPNRKRQRPCRLSASEIMTVMILFHLSHYRTFKDYYRECVEMDMKSYFPKLVSYNRFVEIMSSVVTPLSAYLLSHMGKKTGLYYVDSTTLKVCHNKRIHRHKTFAGIAERGKSSMGWFFGFKPLRIPEDLITDSGRHLITDSGVFDHFSDSRCGLSFKGV